MKEIKIGDKTISPQNECFVIAEIGAMYENIEGMKTLIQKCSDAGADAVKIQTFRAKTLALPGSEFELEDGSKISQYDFFKKYEISRQNHKILFDHARANDIIMFSTPSHYDDVNFLEKLNTPVYKTGSDDLTNYPFLRYIGKKNKPVILSTGMSTLWEIEKAIEAVTGAGNKQIILLQCTTSYPARPEFANLSVMETLEKTFGLPAGYSDHVPGLFPSVMAAAMGACVVEKHVTLDRNLKRPDYEVSIEPHKLKEMVDQIRMIPVLKGSPVKRICPSEKKWRKNARKSLVASKDIKAGDLLSKENIGIMRPGTGIHPCHMEMIRGRKALKNITKNQILDGNMF